MRSFILLLFIVLFNSVLTAQITQDNSYRFFVDMNIVEDDKLTVELITPKFSEQEVAYKFPAMVPGTYKVYDFGQYVSDFSAKDASGNDLPVTKTDVNTWTISDAGSLYKITYKVDDTFDDTVASIKVFEPVGTNIKEGIQFVFNNQGFFGYFDGYLRNEYLLTFNKPDGFYGSTSLNALKRDEKEDVFVSKDYQFLVDNPIMYSLPDTTSINFDEAKIMISVYSESKGISSKDISESLKELMIATRKFLGGKLPAEYYTFIYNFSTDGNSGNYGALEHNLSSFFHFPDIPAQAKSYMINSLMSTSSHEYYHTVTPLNLHSEEIGVFDFNNPVMSKHLWLYEGTTEYFADYIRYREGLMDQKSYLNSIQEKINGSMNYNDSLPFTVMSKGALDQYEDQYLNVYMKGALIGMCLDIIIREESGGTMEYQDLINRLSAKYGKDKPFKDDDLFNDIESMSFPKVREFLDTYVDGPNRIPYDEIFGKIGLVLKKDTYDVIDLGGTVQIGFNQDNYRLKINDLNNTDNKFLTELGIMKGDELISFNGNPITFFNAKDVFGSAEKQAKIGDKLELVVARYDNSGPEKQVKLNAVVSDVKQKYDYELSLSENPTEEQKKLLKLWSGK
ncbi:MAG TPA: peptidase M61 [Ignavibacteria bacterium]|nr:peptidase M61 [Bacteroidota bacterium]HRI84907.1 peptidase M61 [Ignavibacteria bacterium]HRJ99460.1 peptidase M61 [Ignavibacteria bacterium]